jgi:hypothetical protein
MAGFNLPPGVSVNDIPGNRPEDEAEEAFWSELDKKFAEKFPQYEEDIEYVFSHDLDEAVARYVEMARDMGYSKGYDDGVNDLGQAEYWQERQEDDRTES